MNFALNTILVSHKLCGRCFSGEFAFANLGFEFVRPIKDYLCAFVQFGCKLMNKMCFENIPIDVYSIVITFVNSIFPDCIVLELSKYGTYVLVNRSYSKVTLVIMYLLCK